MSSHFYLQPKKKWSGSYKIRNVVVLINFLLLFLTVNSLWFDWLKKIDAVVFNLFISSLFLTIFLFIVQWLLPNRKNRVLFNSTNGKICLATDEEVVVLEKILKVQLVYTVEKATPFYSEFWNGYCVGIANGIRHEFIMINIDGKTIAAMKKNGVCLVNEPNWLDKPSGIFIADICEKWWIIFQ